MSARFINPRPQYLDDAANPIVNGELNFYESQTLTRKDTFSDINLKIKNANPVEVFEGGKTPNIFYAGSARVILTSDSGQEYDLDPVGTSASGSAFEIWNTVIEYEILALVQASDGEYYRSLTNNNIGNDPTVSAASWEKVQFLRTWNTNVTYIIADIVVASDGKLYSSLQNGNVGNDPTTPSPTFWENAIGNPFDQDLNTTDDVEFNQVKSDTLKSSTNTNLVAQAGATIVAIGGAGNTVVAYDGTVTVVRPSLTGTTFLGTSTFKYMEINTEMSILGRGTSLTTDANTLIAGSQIGEANNVQLKFGVDSGSTWDLDIVDASNVTLGLIKHNQTGGANSNGVWTLFPKDNVEPYAWDDKKFGPSSGSFIPNLGATFAPFGLTFTNTLSLTDGVTAPGTVSGQAQMYVDTADGDLKIIFGNGTIKTIVTD